MVDVTISLTAPQAARVAAAFGKQLNTQDMTDPENPVPRDANMAEVKQQVAQFLKSVVFAQERQAAINAITLEAMEPS